MDPQEILAGYLACMLWADGEEVGAYSRDDLADSAIAQALADCTAFATECADDLQAVGLSAEAVGHNFWLTRNRHGAGFWDLGPGVGGVFARLTEASHRYGEVSLYEGDDGFVHTSP